MYHPGFKKGEGVFSDGQGAPVFNGLVVQVGTEMGGKILQTHFGAVNRLIFTHTMHDPRQCSGMIHFGMIADDKIYFFWINNVGNILEHGIGKFTFDRIDEGNFFVENQKCIVARAQPGGITVKISNIPIIDANIIDIFKNFYRFHPFTSTLKINKECPIYQNYFTDKRASLLKNIDRTVSF